MSGGARRPEVYWLVFVLVGATIMLAVVEPARRAAEDAETRVKRARTELQRIRDQVEAMRRERRALESGDRQAWEAAAHAAGLGRPGSITLRDGGPR